jgi:hypothetical protein
MRSQRYGHALVCAEYGYPKGSPNTAATALNTVLASAHK